jgi:ADP-ribose pyrophosphatase YjhB (NUDIX family)
MSSLYQSKKTSPFHISAGAVLVNAEGKVLVHRRIKSEAPEQFANNFTARDEVYILMRESLEDGETIEEAVQRGVQEEFGMKCEVEKYLGSIQGTVPGKDGTWSWEKTTLYFQAKAGAACERASDDESFSRLEWHDPEFLIERMRGQGGVRPDLDESKILEAYVRYR